MKESKRQLQVGELIKRNFGTVLQSEGPFIFSGAFVTVTEVRMSSDLGIAKIYVSVFNAEDKQEVLLLMREHKYRLQQALVTRIRRHVRRIPDVQFYIDDTLDEMEKINNMFDRLNDQSDA